MEHGADPDQGDKGLDGIAEQVTDSGDRRVILDLITGKRTETAPKRIRITSEMRPQAAPPATVEALKADIRSLHDIANRRGGAWLFKWATAFQDIRPGTLPGTLPVNPDADPAYVEYARSYPLGPDLRD
jgi:hypothetical protein